MPFIHKMKYGNCFEARLSTMNFNNFTIKAQEAVQKASEIATGNQQQAIETAHLLKGLLLVDENVITYLLKKLNVNLNRLTIRLTIR
jgi:ATP-dependent Clp protease ATP-binding subunit ClpB